MKSNALRLMRKVWKIMKDPMQLLKAAIALFIGTAFAIFSLDLAIAITGFVCSGIACSILLKHVPNIHDLPKIAISVAAGTLGGLICIFVAELSVIGCTWLVWDFISTFQENLRVIVT